MKIIGSLFPSNSANLIFIHPISIKSNIADFVSINIFKKKNHSENMHAVVNCQVKVIKNKPYTTDFHN